MPAFGLMHVPGPVYLIERLDRQVAPAGSIRQHGHNVLNNAKVLLNPGEPVGGLAMTEMQRLLSLTIERRLTDQSQRAVVGQRLQKSASPTPQWFVANFCTRSHACRT